MNLGVEHTASEFSDSDHYYTKQTNLKKESNLLPVSLVIDDLGDFGAN
jgi:hypothetical protein